MTEYSWVSDCCITNCEYNEDNQCLYCGDYFDLNDPNCIAFIEKYEKENN